MSKKQKAPVRFRAQLPALLSHQVRYVSKKAWRLLPENERGIEKGKNWTNYFHRLPPFDNPAVEKLRRRLKVKRVNYFEWVEPVGGVPFIHFSTLTEDKIA